MSSALSITRAVNPPRAAFIDYPLGHTTGKADQPDLQRDILRQALAAFTTLDTPGQIVTLPFAWAESDDWKLPGGGSGEVADDRTGRAGVPQYQNEEDQRLAEAAGVCEGCVWLD